MATNCNPQNIIRCIDLTRLNENDNESSIQQLCEKAHTPFGNVAAVCVYPEWITTVKKHHATSNIPVATVINFPNGDDNLACVSDAIKHCIQLGADELDIVFPYKRFLSGDESFANHFLATCRNKAPDHRIKIILETGAFSDKKKLTEAAELCIQHKINFLKTSTGKIDIGATPQAVELLANVIKQSKTQTGIKISGGVRTTKNAVDYCTLVSSILGEKWIHPNTFRIGASQLLDEFTT